MLQIPYEKMSINWLGSDQVDRFSFTLPWISMEVDVTEEDRGWISDATAHLHTDPLNSNVQKFIEAFKDYPVSYVKPRKLEEFAGKDFPECPLLDVDLSTPATLLATFGCPLDPSIQEDVIPAWTWDQERILGKARIEGTNLYDPVSFVTYLACYRLEWESQTWLGQDRFGSFLETLLKKDERQFFQAIGWISRQAWQVMTEFSPSMEPALNHFGTRKEVVARYIAEEVGHAKFMEQVFRELDLDKDTFSLEGGTKWLLGSYKRAATLSPLAFSAMVGLFEAAYYEEDELIPSIIRRSSRPNAARGYELHGKVNKEYCHRDIPVHFASCLAPQTRSHALLAVVLFELTLNILNRMEQRLAEGFGVH